VSAPRDLEGGAATLAGQVSRHGLQEARRLKALEGENRRLKLVSDEALHFVLMKGLVGLKW